MACIAALAATPLSAQARIRVIGDYTFDDGFDLASAGFTVVGDAAISGNQVVFDGDADRLEIPDPFGGATDNFLMEAVVTANTMNGVNPGDAFGFSSILSRNQSGQNNGFGLIFESNEVRGLNAGISVRGVNAGAVGGGAAPPPGTPVTVGFLRQNGTSSVYINGDRVVSSSTASVSVGDGIDTLSIGGVDIGGFFDSQGLFGSIDRVRVSTVSPNALFSPNPADDNFLGATGATRTKIMLVGDSFWHANEMRQSIYDNLTAAGLEFDFVGSEGRGAGPAGDVSSVTDPDHEGIASKQLNHILDGRTDHQPNSNHPLSDLLPVHDPDIVGIQAGINDILFNFLPAPPLLTQSSGRTTAQMLANVESIVQTIGDHDPTTRTIVTTLTPVIESGLISADHATGINAQVNEYNAQLELLVADLQGQGLKVLLVNAFDAWGGVATGNVIFDGLHPNALGNQRLADAWSDALTSVVPEPSTLAALGLGCSLACACQRRTLRTASRRSS